MHLLGAGSILIPGQMAFGSFSRRMRKRREEVGGPASIYDIAVSLGVTSNMLVCLDAGAAASYSGGTSQTWTNLVPAGGTSFFRGAGNTAEATDPTFSGVAGSLSPSEYFTLDGGDYFSEVTAAWGDDTFINNDQSFTLVYLFYPTTAALIPLLDNQSSGTWRGITYYASSTRKMGVLFDNGGGTVVSTLSNALYDLNTWNFGAVSINEATGSGIFAINSNVETFNSTRSGSPSSGAGPARIGRRNRTGENAPAGTRLAGVMIWNRQLTSQELTDLYTQVKSRRFTSMP